MAAAQICRRTGRCHILDYGCGNGTLRAALERAFPSIHGVDLFEYDPAIPGKALLPSPVELVFCGDVMEHVEPECVDAVLKHIASLTLSVAIFIIDLHKAAKTLPDGRNAHLTIQKKDWWLSFLRKYFVVIESGSEAESLVAVVQRIPS
jgi:2-polyprenyl-3-methyl-5-hydroxy-6-metoxy-1,4-benzoquinol methylase